MEPVEQELTFGQKAVGLRFNPSRDPDVNRIKQLFANVIDELNAHRVNEECVAKSGGVASKEKLRMYSIAITEAQTAQMWAVKAATWRD